MEYDNNVRMEVQSENHGLNFTLLITDSEGNPIPGFRYRSAGEVLGGKVRRGE